MCGIAGLLNYNKNGQEMMNKMIGKIINRGPDGYGIWKDEFRNVVLGHRRLSILDLSNNGAQPMLSHSGRYVISFNGEIYNHRELALQLCNENYVGSFKGTSDTEVLLELIEAYGLKKALNAINGMFAIAVYDRESGELKLARDRAGEKPLYYGYVNNAFVFGSDIRCFECIDDFCNDINTDVLAHYFKRGVIAAPYTIYKDIYVLEPGTILTIVPPYRFCRPLLGGMQPYYDVDNLYEEHIEASEDMDISYETYWSFISAAVYGQNNIFKGTRRDAVDELENILKGVIRKQSIADVPLGAFLSGGVDSSLVVALMQEITVGKVKTFTIRVDDKDFDEGIYASQIAEILGTEHEEMYVSMDELKDSVINMPKMFDEPFADSSQIPSFFVNKMAKKNVTVSLSGDGGDEIFGGYNSYRFVENSWRKAKKLPFGVRNNCAKLLRMNYGKRNSVDTKRRLEVLCAKTATGLHKALIELECSAPSLLARDVAFESKADIMMRKDILESPLRNAMLFDSCNTLQDDILTKIDRTSMQVSLECRAPFFDKDVIEFAWSLPDEYLIQNGQGKSVLRDILYKRIPREIIERPKKGFSIPVSKWLREGELKEWAESTIISDTLALGNLFDYEAIREMWTQYIKENIWTPQIWYCIMLQQWLRSRENG